MIDRDRIKELTRDFLIAIGENPDREGLQDTPRRVADMCDELLNPEHTKATYTVFNSNDYSGMVLVRNIDFASLCEHHLLPFIGKVHVAYIPSDKIIGISKFGRIIDKRTKQLQLQERLAQQIMDDIQEAINPRGIAIYIEAKHSCMNIRGVNKIDASTVTTMYSGEFEACNMQELFINMIFKH